MCFFPSSHRKEGSPLDTPPKNRRRIWWLTLPLAVLLLGGVFFALALSSGGLSARYDDPDVLLASYDPEAMGELVLHDDGTATLRLSRDDIYYLARENGLLKTMTSEAFPRSGFRISDGRITLYLKGTALGFVPANYRATLSARSSGTDLILHTEKVVLGSRIALSEKRWPAFLREDIPLDLTGIDCARGRTETSLQGSSLVLTLEGLRSDVTGPVYRDDDLLEAVRFFGADRSWDDTIAFLRRGDGPELDIPAVEGRVLTAGDVAVAWTSLLAWCRMDSVPALWSGQGSFARTRLWEPLLTGAVARRSALEQDLLTAQARYERPLFALREMYRSGNVRIDDSGFYNSAREKLDPAALSRLPVTATDSRFVFLFSSEDSGELSFEDMPPLGDVPRMDWQTARLADERLVPELGLVLTTEGGVPALIYRRADGSIAFREISEDLYVSVLVSPAIPRLDIDALPPPARTIPRPSGEAWNGAALMPLPLPETSS